MSLTGAAEGASTGASLGFEAGSVIPGIGNVVGGVVGTALGALIGALGGNKKAVNPWLSDFKANMSSAVVGPDDTADYSGITIGSIGRKLNTLDNSSSV